MMRFLTSKRPFSLGNRPINTTIDIQSIFTKVKEEENPLIIFDIDDTVGRVSQTIGLDSWFRSRIAQFASEGHEASRALLLTISINNAVQMASSQMIGIDPCHNIAELIQSAQNQGIKIIALTARNNGLVTTTVQQIASLGVKFSDDVILPGMFNLNDKPVHIQNGIIFANGNHKGDCLYHAEPHFIQNLHSYTSVSFIDDNEKNCLDVASTLHKQGIKKYHIWHYQYAEKFLPFTPKQGEIAKIQETYFLNHRKLLSDIEAENLLAHKNDVSSNTRLIRPS